MSLYWRLCVRGSFLSLVNWGSFSIIVTDVFALFVPMDVLDIDRHGGSALGRDKYSDGDEDRVAAGEMMMTLS